MDSIGVRIDKTIKNSGLTQKDFAEKIDVSEQAIGNYINNRRFPKAEILLKMKQVFNVSVDWLLTGDNETNVNAVREPESLYNRIPSVITIPEKDQEKENIEIVPVKLAAGYVGGGYAKSDFIQNLPKFRLPYLNNGTFRCFGVGGYSMHNGIQDEDWFVGKFVDNLFNLSEGKIHAVIAPKADSLLIKRVFRHPTKADYLILRSDNNDIFNSFPDIEIHIESISELWSYAGLISFKEPAYDFSKFREILSLNHHKVTVD